MSLYHLDHSPEFPKRKFAPAGGSVTVQNKHAENALGLGWSDSEPSPAAEVEAEAAPPDEFPEASTDRPARRGKK